MSVWDRLAGQERARRILQAAAREPGDAYLFSGPPGVGKADAARIFAAAILCPDQCGECSVCSRVLRGIHPDVQVLEPEGLTYPVELIREAVASTSRTPLEAARRVMIMEGAERIVERSQNALLKALEEPAASVTWVLVAGSIEPFLPTVLSRCRMVEFAPVPEAEVARLIASFDLTAEQQEVILRSSRGDIDVARALAADEPARELRALAIEAATAGKSDPNWALQLADRVREAAGAAREAREAQLDRELQALDESMASPGAWRKRVIDRNKRILRKAETDVFSDFLVWLAAAFRDLAAASSGAAPSELTIRDRSDEVVAAARRGSTAAWLNLSNSALAGQLAIVENANPGLVVESVLLRLITLGTSAGVAQG